MSENIKNIVIVGVGALGSHVVLFGRNLGASYKVIDFDRVEQKNTLSQFHTRMGVGRNKAQGLQQSLQGLFGLKIQAVPHKLTADNASQLLDGADLVVDCLDNGASRRLVQVFAREQGVPCLHGALAADGHFGRVIWDAHFAIDDEDVEGQATCEDGEQLPFIAMAASVMVQSIQAFLKDGRKTSLHLHPGGTTIVNCEEPA